MHSNFKFMYALDSSTEPKRTILLQCSNKSHFLWSLCITIHHSPLYPLCFEFWSFDAYSVWYVLFGFDHKQCIGHKESDRTIFGLFFMFVFLFRFLSKICLSLDLFVVPFDSFCLHGTDIVFVLLDFGISAIFMQYPTVICLHTHNILFSPWLLIYLFRFVLTCSQAYEMSAMPEIKHTFSS